MTDAPYKKADAYLGEQYPHLLALLKKVQTIKTINQHFLNLLEPHIKPYCTVANVMGDHLVIIVANGSIATQLRFQAPDIIKLCSTHSQLSMIKRLSCKVQPLFNSLHATPQKAPKKMAPLSQKSSKAFREMATSIEDKRLKEIMERIASYTD